MKPGDYVNATPEHEETDRCGYNVEFAQEECEQRSACYAVR